MRNFKPNRLLAHVLLAPAAYFFIANDAWAQFDPGREATEAPGVAAPFPDPAGVRFATPLLLAICPPAADRSSMPYAGAAPCWPKARLAPLNTDAGPDRSSSSNPG